MSDRLTTPIMDVGIGTAAQGRVVRGGPHDRRHRLHQAAASRLGDLGEPVSRQDVLLLFAGVQGAVRARAGRLLSGATSAAAPPAGHPGDAVAARSLPIRHGPPTRPAASQRSAQLTGPAGPAAMTGVLALTAAVVPDCPGGSGTSGRRRVEGSGRHWFRLPVRASARRAHTGHGRRRIPHHEQPHHPVAERASFVV